MTTTNQQAPIDFSNVTEIEQRLRDERCELQADILAQQIASARSYMLGNGPIPCPARARIVEIDDALAGLVVLRSIPAAVLRVIEGIADEAHEQHAAIAALEKKSPDSDELRHARNRLTHLQHELRTRYAAWAR
jgi:hypothetical protein